MPVKNRTVYDYDLLLEFNRNHQRVYHLVLTVLLLIVGSAVLFSTAMGGIQFLLGHGPAPEPSTLVASALYLGFIGFYLIYVPLARRKSSRKNAERGMAVEYVFGEDSFTAVTTSTVGREQGEMKYAVITKVTETESAYCLYVNRMAAHLVSKSGFTEGTAQDFVHLLRVNVDPKKLKIK